MTQERPEAGERAGDEPTPPPSEPAAETAASQTPLSAPSLDEQADMDPLATPPGVPSWFRGPSAPPAPLVDDGLGDVPAHGPGGISMGAVGFLALVLAIGAYVLLF